VVKNEQCRFSFRFFSLVFISYFNVYFAKIPLDFLVSDIYTEKNQKERGNCIVFTISEVKNKAVYSSLLTFYLILNRTRNENKVSLNNQWYVEDEVGEGSLKLDI